MVESCLDFNMVHTRIQLVGNETLVCSMLFTLSLSQTSTRQRIKRVTLRDVLFLMEQERSLGKSTLLYKTFLKWCMARTMQVQSDRCAIQHFFCEIWRVCQEPLATYALQVFLLSFEWTKVTELYYVGRFQYVGGYVDKTDSCPPKVADNGPTLFCGMSIGHEFLRVSKNEKCWILSAVK